MSNTNLYGVIRLVFTLLLASITFIAHAGEVAIIAESTSIGNSKASATHEIAFNVGQIPEEPKIEVQFKVKTAGSCNKTYEPTTFFMNGDSFAELDFRDFDLGSDMKLTLDVPHDLMVVGENQLKVITGECQFGVDSMNMDKMTLL